MTADQAFDYLRRISSITNVKLADVAAEIAGLAGFPTSPDGSSARRPLLDHPGLGSAASPGCCSDLPDPFPLQEP